MVHLGSLSQTHPLAMFSETREFWPCKRPGPNTNRGLTLQKAWPQYRQGDPKKWPLNGIPAFARSREGLRISLCLVLHGPQSESGFEGLMLHVSFCCLPIPSSPSVSLSIRFPRRLPLDLSYATLIPIVRETIEVLMKEVSIIFSDSNIVWFQVKQQGGNTGPPTNRKSD